MTTRGAGDSNGTGSREIESSIVIQSTRRLCLLQLKCQRFTQLSAGYDVTVQQLRLLYGSCERGDTFNGK